MEPNDLTLWVESHRALVAGDTLQDRGNGLQFLGDLANNVPVERGVERSAHSVTEHRQPLDGLVAEHEADVTIRDLAAPAAHRGGGDLVLEQTSGDVFAVESQGGDIEEERPGCRRPHSGKAVELPERLVAPPLPFCVRRSQVLVRHPKSDAGSDLREAARNEAVVDVDPRDVVHELTRRDDPADPPRDHSLLERPGAHRDRWGLQHAAVGGPLPPARSGCSADRPVRRRRVVRLQLADLESLLRIPLDNCLVTNNLVVTGHRHGADVGSDHFPLVVDLAVL